MPQILQNITLDLDEDLREKLALLSPGFVDFRILRKSIDARGQRRPRFIYSVEVAAPGESLDTTSYELEKISPQGIRPLIIGAGPAGLFAALRLVERGIPCQLLERGSQATERLKRINRFWRYGELDANNNVCFGEGGAGLYSDGKLITRIKSPHIGYVMNRLVRFGAPDEIQYLANPHVGSDRIRRVIPKIREHLLAHGCAIHFDTQVTDLLLNNNSVQGVVTAQGQTFHSPMVILATGHSAHDIFLLLHQREVFMEGKSFAIGLRIEHPQLWINKIQYREAAQHPKLGAANYKITHHDKERGVGVYSFCMCPGGYVVSASTESDGVVCNGMSNYHRNSPFANSAIAVTIDHEKWFGEDLFGGLKLRRELEKRAFGAVQKAGGDKQLPAQTLNDFLRRRSTEILKSSSPSGVAPVALDRLIPDPIYQPLVQALENFEQKMPGFIHDQALFHGIESRTSCPLRITRDGESLQSLSHPGLYPCGEGAGYAGGITSAAVDGVRVAEALIREISATGSRDAT